VHVGEAQINIPAPNPGLSGGGGQNPGLFNSGPGGNPPPGTPPTGLAQTQNPPSGQPQNQAGGTGQLGSLTTTGIGNGQTIGGGQIMGVASVSKGHAIKEFNDKDQYDEWYFVYDLRLEQSGGSGVTVAAPRAGGNTPGSSGAPGTQGATGSQNAPGPSGQPTPVQTPAPTPPQN
jgi:hypothetical protein